MNGMRYVVGGAVVGNYRELTFLDQTDLQLTEKTLFKNIPMKVSSFNFIYTDGQMTNVTGWLVGWYGSVVTTLQVSLKVAKKL